MIFNILCPVCNKRMDIVFGEKEPGPYYSAREPRANHLKKSPSCDSFEDWKLGYIVELVKTQTFLVKDNFQEHFKVTTYRFGIHSFYYEVKGEVKPCLAIEDKPDIDSVCESMFWTLIGEIT